MKRGINRTVETKVERRVTYSITREALLKRLRLPADAAVYLQGEELTAGSDEVCQVAIVENR